MKRNLVGLLCVMVFIVGCSEDVKTPASEESLQIAGTGEPISIVDVSREPSSKRIYSIVESGGVRREITVEPLRSDGWPVGIRAGVSDPSGEDLFTLEIAWDASNPGNIWFRETSGEDWMTGAIEQTGDEVREIYAINGLERSFVYKDIDPEAKRHALRFLYEDPSDRINDPDALQYIDVLADFGEFYSANVPPALQDNAAGELLLTVLGSAELANRAAGRDSEGNTPLLDKRADQVCGIAFVCAKLKCIFGGGWVNPLCIACGGTTLACGIAHFSCTFIVDCD